MKALIPLVIMWFTVLPPLQSQDNNPLASGEWLKFSISSSGMYRIDASDHSQLEGEPVSQLRVLTLPAGPLPQLNGEGLPPVISDIPVSVVEDGDGIFNGSDYIVFFANGPDSFRYVGEEIQYRPNPYSRYNYIFVGINGQPGLRIEERLPVNTGGPVITTYQDLRNHETTSRNLLSSGRTWYGERFDGSTNLRLSFDFPNAIAGGNVQVVSKVMAQSFGTCRFSLFIDGNKSGEQIIDPVPDFNNPPSNNPFQFAVKGREKTDEFNALLSGEEVIVELEFDPAAVTLSDGYLDYLYLAAESHLRLSSNQQIFQGPQFMEPSFSVHLEAPSEIPVWDISDGMTPVIIGDYTFDNGILSFNDEGNETKRYVAFDPDALPGPDFIEDIKAPDILSGNADMLIITPPEFLPAATRLASHRSSTDGLTVKVIRTDELYDLFGSGKADPTTIRNAARWHYMNGGLKYVLLMGKASFDYLDILPFKTNFVPTYESRSSLDPLATFASDDYFGFMEPGEGEWPEEAGGNHTLELGIGRIPVISLDEAQTAVDKIIRYDNPEESAGSWRTSLLFVADDEDANLHHRQADRLANLVDTTDLNFQNHRMFLGSFEQQTTGGGESSPQMNEALVREIWKGALIVNYTGHGNVTSWAQEQVFTPAVINSLRNRNKLPLFVTATCEFGRFDDPREISGAELLIKSPQGGGIGILSTCRPVFSSSNFNLNKAFYTALTDPDFQQSARLGDLMLITKNSSVDLAIDSRKVGNRNFTLFGDPSMRLGIPSNRIELTSIQADGMETDTLRSGSRITIRGQVIDNPGFSGTVDIRLRDKEAELQTIVNPRYTYSEKTNSLFSGKSKIVNGQFETSFIMPRNISNKPGIPAQFYLYAYSGDNRQEASGTRLIQVAGASDNTTDDTGPEIEIFFGDSTNLSRSDVNDNTLVYVRLKDESGINTSGFGVNNNLMAILDGGADQIVLNEYYQAATDNYQDGWVIFPLNDLSPGSHTLTFRAWDVFNNAGSRTVTFDVADPGTLVVKSLRNYPNPFYGTTSISFEHNRSGEDLDIRITIINRSGQMVREISYLETDSRGRIVLPSVDLENLAPGLYVYGVHVRSRQDGATDAMYQKMMLIN